MSIIAARNAIVSKIAEAIPALREVTAHDGRFDLDEVRRWAAKAPSVRVAVLGAPTFGAQGRQPYAEVRFGAFLLCAGVPTAATRRGDEALAYVDQLCALIATNDWGLSTTQAPIGMSAQNMFTAQLDKLGIAMWAFTWRQHVDIALLSPAELDDLLTVYASYDLAEADESIDAEDAIALEGP